MSAKLQKKQLTAKNPTKINGAKEGLEKVLEDFNQISENNQKVRELLGRLKDVITD